MKVHGCWRLETVTEGLQIHYENAHAHVEMNCGLVARGVTPESLWTYMTQEGASGDMVFHDGAYIGQILPPMSDALIVRPLLPESEA